MTVGDVKCRTESSGVESAPNGEYEKCASSNKSGKEADNDQSERKKKTRRRKTKRKNPYSKHMSENRGGKKNIRVRAGKSTYEQPVAPYNSNQFLIEDHNDLQDFDMKLMEAVNRGADQPGDLGPARTGRVRDPSFTSADSEEDHFYSSPEDEEEFLTKEFSNTYQDLHVESLTAMSKSELIQTVIHLEEKIDTLQKRIGDTKPEDGDKPDDRILNFQSEIARLVLANQKLLNENLRLREIGEKRCSSSTQDSESDSTSSSTSSEINTSSVETIEYKNMNGGIHEENDINMEQTDNT